ncbi:MAG TPA: thioredoxin-like domain-containing protein [Pirellulales bacterium]|jgi:DNA-binding beta-propeller fold protein YncE
MRGNTGAKESDDRQSPRPARGAACGPALVLLALAIVAGGLSFPTALSVASAQPAAPKAAPESDDAEPDDEAHPFARRIPAPDLTGGEAWINTAGPIDMKDLRGKYVILDFWTYCCINCMHILPELKKLEETFPNELVVIGVHSAKFENEEDSKNITEAVLRNEIKHPVVNDAKHVIWDRFQARSWPTMYLIDPEGNVVYGRNGEFKADEIEAVIRRSTPYYKKKGKLDSTPLHFDLAEDRAVATPLRFPGKVLADEQGKRLFIADSNHNRIVITDLDGALKETIGSGAIGTEDGGFATAMFNHPQGMALHGDTLYVADTENHMLRKVDLVKKNVTTICGSGKQARFPWPGVDPKALAAAAGPIKWPERWVALPKETELSSPWDLLVHDKDLYIAMAGSHQIWKMALDESEIGPIAGNGREDIVDGPMLPKEPFEEGYASFAQPSGLASDGKQLFVADSEGSSIREAPFNPKQPVKTLLGTADQERYRLFTFGDQDGVGNKVKFQHLLGITAQNGKLYVADTYNNKIKVVDIQKKSAKTIAGSGKPGHEDGREASFDEPAGLSAAGGKLYVADTNNHLIRTVDLRHDNAVATLDIKGLAPPKPTEVKTSKADAGAPRVEVKPVTLQPADGLVWLAVKLALPEGWDLNKEAPMRYKISAEGKTGPVNRAKIGVYQKVEPLTEFQIEIPLSATSGKETIDVALDYFYCRKGAEGICKAGTVHWIVPLTLDPKAATSKAPVSWTVQQ